MKMRNLTSILAVTCLLVTTTELMAQVPLTLVDSPLNLGVYEQGGSVIGTFVFSNANNVAVNAQAAISYGTITGDPTDVPSGFTFVTAPGSGNGTALLQPNGLFTVRVTLGIPGESETDNDFGTTPVICTATELINSQWVNPASGSFNVTIWDIPEPSSLALLGLGALSLLAYERQRRKAKA